MINKLFNLFGLQISYKKKASVISFHDDYDKKINYEYENEANELIKIVRKNTMLPFVNLVTLYEQVLFCETHNIEGDFVECGVWKGGAVGLMAAANLKLSKNRRDLHLFDVFDDICAPDEKVDGKRAINEMKQILGAAAGTKGELLPQKGIYDSFGGHGTIDACNDLIKNKIAYPADNIIFHKGWFQDTLPADSKLIKKIAILRLDGDWYASTKICLDYLFDKVVPGGFIIIDDYGLYSGCRKAVDEFLHGKKEQYFFNYSSWSCRYIIKKPSID